MTNLPGSVPEAHRDAVARAIDAAFCGTEATNITPLLGGRSSALVYQLDVDDHRYVLRLVTARNALSDPVRQFAALRIASDDGIAPKLIYADAEAGIAISAFIASEPWAPAFAANTERVADLGKLLRALHDGPAMPTFLHSFHAIEQGLLVITNTGAVLPPLFVSFLEEFAEVRAALEPHIVLGASHNDLNPGNLLFDGSRSWIIDWESAWQNDPMFDVATVLHWFGFGGAQEEALLRGYFGDRDSTIDRAKLELMRQVVSCYYATVFLLLTFQQGEVPPAIDPDPATLATFADTRVGMANGTFPLDTAEQRTLFAVTMLQDARRRAAEPAFAEAVALLRARPATPRT